ncbi:hypothetical protein [Rhizobium sp.]|uniref:hypothetical protein n=1 Tax=Rhizobium sp. TaxID=391 RepID=UPI002AA7C124
MAATITQQIRSKMLGIGQPFRNAITAYPDQRYCRYDFQQRTVNPWLQWSRHIENQGCQLQEIDRGRHSHE